MKILDLLNEVSTGNYYSKAHKSKISAASKMMFADPEKPETQKAMRDFKNRTTGMSRVSDRNKKASAAQQDQLRQQQIEQDKENLPTLIKQLEKLKSQYDPNFEYSDDYSFWSKQKELQKQISSLQSRINTAGGTQESASVGSTSTASGVTGGEGGNLLGGKVFRRSK
jgi:hypothetical protein